jgi:hypothetical protein
VRRSVAQAYLDLVRTYRATPAYHKALRKRSVWIEPLFGEAKQWHQLVQFRLRRLEKVNIQALLIAAGQNIKRLLKARRFNSPLRPAQAAALALPPTTIGPFLCNFWFTKVEAFSFSTRLLAFAKHFFNTLRFYGTKAEQK